MHSGDCFKAKAAGKADVGNPGLIEYSDIELSLRNVAKYLKMESNSPGAAWELASGDAGSTGERFGYMFEDLVD